MKGWLEMRNKILKLIRWILLPVAPLLGWFILNAMYNSTCAYMEDGPGELSLTFIVKLFMDGAIVPMSAFLIAPKGKKIFWILSFRTDARRSAR